MLSRSEKDKLKEAIFDVKNQRSPFMLLVTSDSESPERFVESQFKKFPQFKNELGNLISYKEPLVPNSKDGEWITLLKNQVHLAIENNEVKNVDEGKKLINKLFTEFKEDINNIKKDNDAVMVKELTSKKDVLKKESNLPQLNDSLNSLQEKCKISKDKNTQVLGEWLTQKVNGILKDNTTSKSQKYDDLLACMKGMEDAIQKIDTRSRVQKVFYLRAHAPTHPVLIDIKKMMPKDVAGVAKIIPTKQELDSISNKVFLDTKKKAIPLNKIMPDETFDDKKSRKLR